MKNAKAMTVSFLLVVIGTFCWDASAQGNAHGHQKKEQNKHHHHKKIKNESHEKIHSHSGHGHVRIARPVDVHQLRRDCNHRVIVYRYDRPRYVYYSDHDIYYDNHRDVYISYSGGRWVASASLPWSLHRIDLRRAHRVQVEYLGDDFVAYLDHSRPILAAVYVTR